jgi:DNA-nicking Smr family endonuclease
VERQGEPQPAAGEAPRVVDLAGSRDAVIDDFLAVARAGASGAGGLFTAVGSDVDPDLALDWWLRATRLPRLGWTEGSHVAAFAVAAPPEAPLPPWARLRWFTAAARRGSAERARRILRQLAASERHHPSAPHFCVPVLAVPPEAGATGAARRLLEAVQERSAAHPTSTGVCCETGDAAVSALLEDLGHRPAARFRADGVRRSVFFRPDAGATDLDEPVVVPIEDSIDLHRFRPGEVGEVVAGYVEAAFEAGLREVRIIHGRGRGVQRHRVQRLLARDPRVERFSDAPADRGGRGATIAWLSAREGKRR